LVAFGLFTIS